MVTGFVIDPPIPLFSDVDPIQGLTMFPAAEKFFEDDEKPKGFGFVVADIQEIRPIVRVGASNVRPDRL